MEVKCNRCHTCPPVRPVQLPCCRTIHCRTCAWNAIFYNGKYCWYSSCSGNPVTRSHTRTYRGGLRPCSGIDTESETCCINPIPSISFQQCFQSCSSTMGGGHHSFQGSGVFTDDVPESSYDHWWMGDVGQAPQRLRIAFSCPKTISSVRLRNSGYRSGSITQPRRLTLNASP